MRFILGAVFGVLVIIFMIQNTQIVEIQFLGWSLSISRALMVLIVFAVGIGLGWVIRSIGYLKKRRQAVKP
ncbi:MAG: lipopolysaccharide assembly protein LapA domain-containing protein [Spirochaetota bacterium]